MKENQKSHFKNAYLEKFSFGKQASIQMKWKEYCNIHTQNVSASRYRISNILHGAELKPLSVLTPTHMDKSDLIRVIKFFQHVVELV